MSFYQASIYKNVMELLVDEEIQRQTRQNQPDQPQELNLIEVSTYALNRLPPLYASSQEGFYRQKQRGQKELGQRIKITVHEAITVTRKAPLRLTTPILPDAELEAESQIARMALESLI